MRFYTKTHQYYCGIDLHAKTMYVCILNADGAILVHRNIRTDQARFLALIEPYRDNLVVSVECIFTWYWIADVCARENIAFVLGHALYMKAIHGGKAKNDKLDSHKIALLPKGGSCLRRMPIPPPCGPPAICCAGGCTSHGSGRI